MKCEKQIPGTNHVLAGRQNIMKRRETGLATVEKSSGLDIELIDTVISVYHDPGKGLLTPHMGSPVDVLVKTILSQATSDIQSEKAFNNLKRLFPSWEEVAQADPRDVQSAISPAGLAAEKARNIQAALQKIRNDMRKISLEKLAGMDPPEAMAYLRTLPGVGPKTAACTLLFGFGMPVFPVDTHILRIAGRLGIIPPGTPAERAQTAMNDMVPPDKMLAFHLGLIEHGRKVCTKRKPKCERCAILRWCAQREV